MIDREQELEKKKAEHFRETAERLTAASHVKVEYFADHQKIEGYFESHMAGNLFGCDRLMKIDNMFGTVQLGYNPNRERVFLFANLKTSRYDTVASRYQKEMKEYQMKSLLKGDNENRAYVSKRWEMSTVLIEKKENKPWTRRSIAAYLGRANTEAVKKTLPFFLTSEESGELEKAASRRKELQELVAELQNMDLQEQDRDPDRVRRDRDEKVRQFRKEAVENEARENLLQSILLRKSSASRLFLRRLNYAYDYQKKDIINYYRERRKTLEETRTDEEPPEGRPEDEDQ